MSPFNDSNEGSGSSSFLNAGSALLRAPGGASRSQLRHPPGSSAQAPIVAIVSAPTATVAQTALLGRRRVAATCAVVASGPPDEFAVDFARVSAPSNSPALE